MHLVVARDAMAARIEHQRRAANATRIGNGDGRRTPDDPHAVLARDACQKILLRSGTVRFPRGDLVDAARTEYSEILRQQHELRAATRSFGDVRLDGCKIRFDIATGNGLHCGDPKALHAHFWVDSAGTAAVAGLRPTRSTTGSDQLPLTTYS